GGGRRLFFVELVADAASDSALHVAVTRADEDGRGHPGPGERRGPGALEHLAAEQVDHEQQHEHRGDGDQVLADPVGQLGHYMLLAGVHRVFRNWRSASLKARGWSIMAKWRAFSSA